MRRREDAGVNGSGRPNPRQLAAVGRDPLAYDDPMTRVLDLDATSSGALRWLGYGLAAVALLLGLMVGVRALGLLLALTDRAPPAASGAQEVDVVRDEPPPPPPEAPPVAPEPKPEPAPPPPRALPHEAPPPPPAPAQAGKVLAQEPDPNEPVDLTGNTFVSGNSDSYAGGVTAANGTNKVAVRGITAPNGVSGRLPAASPTGVESGPDRSRPPSVENVDWGSAPFPSEADTAQIDEAYVTLEIEIRPDGTPSSVRVVKDPGNGFGREARRFALSKRFIPALDRAGQAMTSTKMVNVHYTR